MQHLALCLGVLLPAALASPVHTVENHKRGTSAGKYIITLKHGASAATVESHISWVHGIHRRSLSSRAAAGVQRTFGISHWNAYAGEFGDDTIQKIKGHSEVLAVEEDVPVQIWRNAGGVLDQRDLNIEGNATWGLGTLSHRISGESNYLYDSSAGAGSYAYVVDSGIQISHEEFEGRASLGYSAFDGDHNDTLGHGTHVSGTIAGKTYGVAKKANLVSVKVLQTDSALNSIILSGYEWAVTDIISKSRQKISVINLSLGTDSSVAWTSAVAAAYQEGVLSVVAAGNGDDGKGTPVDQTSPANAPEAITVGAIDADWHPAVFSNFGPGVDIMAPGVNVVSAYIGADNATAVYSGTSMATPHVTGLALYLQVFEGGSTPDDVTTRIKELGTTGGITGDLNGSPNLIAYNGDGS